MLVVDKDLTIPVYFLDTLETISLRVAYYIGVKRESNYDIPPHHIHFKNSIILEECVGENECKVEIDVLYDYYDKCRDPTLLTTITNFLDFIPEIQEKFPSDVVTVQNLVCELIFYTGKFSASTKDLEYGGVNNNQTALLLEMNPAFKAIFDTSREMELLFIKFLSGFKARLGEYKYRVTQDYTHMNSLDGLEPKSGYTDDLLGGKGKTDLGDFYATNISFSIKLNLPIKPTTLYNRIKTDTSYIIAKYNQLFKCNTDFDYKILESIHHKNKKDSIRMEVFRHNNSNIYIINVKHVGIKYIYNIITVETPLDGTDMYTIHFDIPVHDSKLVIEDKLGLSVATPYISRALDMMGISGSPYDYTLNNITGGFKVHGLTYITEVIEDMIFTVDMWRYFLYRNDNRVKDTTNSLDKVKRNEIMLYYGYGGTVTSIKMVKKYIQFTNTIPTFMENDNIHSIPGYKIGDTYVKMSINVRKSRDIIWQKLLIEKLLGYYFTHHNSIIKDYGLYLKKDDLNAFIDGPPPSTRKKTNHSIMDIEPLLFPSNYSKMCQAPRQPIIIDDEGERKKHINRILINKQKKSSSDCKGSNCDESLKIVNYDDYEIKFPSEPIILDENKSINSHFYVSNSRKFPYIGLMANIGDNEKTTSKLPCTYGKKPVETHINIPSSHVYKGKSLMEHPGGTTPRLGNIPEEFMGKIFNQFNTYYKTSVPISPNSILYCLESAYGRPGADLGIVRKKLLRKNTHLEIIRQETPLDDIKGLRSVLGDPNVYLDPHKFINLLEYRYECNIHIMVHDEGEEKFVLPSGVKFSYYKNRGYTNNVFVYEHSSTNKQRLKHLEYNHYELIGVKRAPCDMIYLISPIDQGVKHIFHDEGLIDRIDKYYKYFYTDIMVNYIDIIKYSTKDDGGKSLNFTHQYIDKAGKCRGVYIKVPGVDKTIFFYMLPPTSPYNLPYRDRPVNITPDGAGMEVFYKLFTMLPHMDIKNRVMDGNDGEYEGLICTLNDDIRLYFPSILTKSYKKDGLLKNIKTVKPYGQNIIDFNIALESFQILKDFNILPIIVSLILSETYKRFFNYTKKIGDSGDGSGDGSSDDSGGSGGSGDGSSDDSGSSGDDSGRSGDDSGSSSGDSGRSGDFYSKFMTKNFSIQEDVFIYKYDNKTIKLDNMTVGGKIQVTDIVYNQISKHIKMLHVNTPNVFESYIKGAMPFPVSKHFFIQRPREVILEGEAVFTKWVRYKTETNHIPVIHDSLQDRELYIISCDLGGGVKNYSAKRYLYTDDKSTVDQIISKHPHEIYTYDKEVYTFKQGDPDPKAFFIDYNGSDGIRYMVQLNIL
jgi:hypothetical protein